MNKIKFSHDYLKFPLNWKQAEFKLLQVFIIDYTDLSKIFKRYDTLYYDSETRGEYPLPKTKLLILLFANADYIWRILTTIRRWTPQKEKYYKSKVGEVFKFIKEMK